MTNSDKNEDPKDDGDDSWTTVSRSRRNRKIIPKTGENSTNRITATNSNSSDAQNNQVQPLIGKIVTIKQAEIPLGVLHLYRELNECNDHSPSNQINSLNTQEENLHSKSLILAVIAIPSYFTCTDFLKFVGSFKNAIEHFRLIKDSNPNKYMMIMKFRESESCDAFYQKYNGRPFSSLQPELCHVIYVKTIEFQSTCIPSYSFPFFEEPNYDPQRPPTHHSVIELPTCPVCLERMDSSTTGLLTILCQHTFHCHCLSKWGDGSCPVCRYTQEYINNPDENRNACQQCGSTQNLWICLICANIGCGRYQNGHARSHYENSSHSFSLELETQRVWDYVGDGYVHRLIQNKADGKLVELPGPDNQTTSNIQGVLPQEKLEALSVEYTGLLTTHLESQKLYYEDQMSAITKQLSMKTTEMDKLMEKVDFLSNRLNVLEKTQRDKHSLEKQVKALKSQNYQLEKSYQTEKELNKSLIENQDKMIKQLSEKDTVIRDLQEQISDLMRNFELQSHLLNNPLKDELVNGTLVVSQPSSSASALHSSSKKSSKKKR